MARALPIRARAQWKTKNPLRIEGVLFFGGIELAPPLFCAIIDGLLSADYASHNILPGGAG